MAFLPPLLGPCSVSVLLERNQARFAAERHGYLSGHAEIDALLDRSLELNHARLDLIYRDLLGADSDPDPIAWAAIGG